MTAIFAAPTIRTLVGALSQFRRPAAGHDAKAATPAAILPPAGPATLVTGGTGFIGAALVARLVADGRRVIVLSRNRSRAEAKLGPTVQVVRSLDEIAAETPVEAVVNLAGAPVLGRPWTAKRRAVLVGSRIGTTQAVVALATRLHRRPTVLISASAVGYYGASADPAPCREDTAPQPQQFPSRLCAAWEVEAERVGRSWMRVVRLRLGTVLGRGGGMLPPMAAAARLGLGAVLGSGRQPLPWISLDDAVGLILFAIDQPDLDGPVNAVAPEAVDQAGFAQALAAHIGRRVRLRLPAAPLRAALGEASQLLLHGRPIAPTAALASGFVFQHPTLQAALAAAVPQAAPAHYTGQGRKGTLPA